MNKSPTAIKSRTIAAILGGFITANLLSMALVSLLQEPKLNAVLIAMCSGFLLYVLIVICVFAVKTAKTAWLSLLTLNLLSLLIIGVKLL